MWRKAMVYLGLGDDAGLDDYGTEEPVEPERAPTRERQPQRQSSSSYPEEPSAIASVRPIGTRPGAERAQESELGQTIAPTGAVQPQPRPKVVRPVAVMPNAKPFVVIPTSYNHAQDVADRYKSNQPVIMNLQEADQELSRRLIDFSSGLCYGLGGKMERVAQQVFLLTPTNVEVSAEERRRLEERDYQS